MNKIHSNGKRFFVPAIAAGLALAMAFTLSACGGDGGGDEVSASSSSGNGSLSSSSSGGGSLSSSGSGSSSSGTSSSSSQPPPKCGSVEYKPAEKFCDERGEKKLYKYVEIDGQNWMAENLNYNAPDSRCYGDNTGGDSEGKCAEYGRLYDWNTAMGGAASSDANPSGVQGVCPSGWHLPSNAEWDRLYRYADGTSGTDSPYESPTAGRYLKAASGWNSCGPSGSGNSYLCEDAHGFSALPGGNGDSGGNSYNAGYNGSWWSASEYDSDLAYIRRMGYYGEVAHWYSNDKYYLHSVRCLQD
ncbi:MAG: hypothetical protein LBH25_13515 [Fibromonadaceae bacterium]|jgi:uncharacterized protein (TIGR02145 family)|nr:hypothetical protein [Fibromonadaceae bacterium]